MVAGTRNNHSHKVGGPRLGPDASGVLWELVPVRVMTICHWAKEEAIPENGSIILQTTVTCAC